jgi:hypothetical protein
LKTELHAARPAVTMESDLATTTDTSADQREQDYREDE